MKKISRESNGARFYKVDIHIHTPSSLDQKYLTEKNKTAFGFPENQKDLIEKFGTQSFDSEVKKIADKFVDKLIDNGLNLVAFTDHNTPSFIDNDAWEKGNWYNSVKNAIKRAEEDKRVEKGRIKVLPGVELTTARVHILAVFNDLDEKGVENELAPFNIANLLNEIGFRANDVGEFVSRTGGRSVYHALQLIIEYGGVPVIAHIDGPGRSFKQSAFDFKKRRKTKGGRQAVKFEFKSELEAIIAISELAVMEYVDEKARIIANMVKSETWMEALTELRDEATISERQKGIKPELAFVRNSDAHQFEDIAKRYSYIKMGDLNYKSFFYAFHEPKNRVWPDVKGDPTEPKHQIDGMAITGGFLDSATHRFNPWINCLIGDVSSGKTTRVRNLNRALKELTGTQADDYEGDICYVTLRIKDGGTQSLWALKTDLKNCKTSYWKLDDNYKPLAEFQNKPNELTGFKPEFICGSKIYEETKANKIFNPPLAEQCWSVIEEKINSSKNSPLIIDEVEQCLTDKLIEQNLIPALDKCRTDRQIIITSNESNIPIVLDAENIIIVDKKTTLAAGSIEQEKVKPLLVGITEGGETVHQEKLRRYGHVLKVEK